MLDAVGVAGVLVGEVVEVDVDGAVERGDGQSRPVVVGSDFQRADAAAEYFVALCQAVACGEQDDDECE